ncbi:pyridoxamine 5'-phosphate oxidase family protein [Pseudonocardia sp. TRM90224]|uniref:pyridoxamine 5'-phosphate oxidase family protein n=1 Tax=Pseudonocardia sp. TRM90224 TaxID=2812678 RepID=UPI001E43840F|nr:pyridoxamine 5'-phosphate oxidase family protein [Pseudonocardia sp. TRM90224]
MASTSLTDADLRFLAGPRLGFLTVAPRSETAWPAPRPVWFEAADDGTIQLFSSAESPKVRAVEAEPRASLVAANAVGEPENWVAVVGTATVHTDGASELAARLGARYWDLDDPAQAANLKGMVESDLVRIVIEPERVTRYG